MIDVKRLGRDLHESQFLYNQMMSYMDKKPAAKTVNWTVKLSAEEKPAYAPKKTGMLFKRYVSPFSNYYGELDLLTRSMLEDGGAYFISMGYYGEEYQKLDLMDYLISGENDEL